MGVVQVTATLRNPAQPERSWEGAAKVEFMGEVGSVALGFGADSLEPILGLAALESAGMEVVPVSQRLKRRPAVRMQSVA